ncbi:hypothetical protein TSUD_271320 [Trifolium subterraneum]|uniref:Uncharacterized protein n=1 Tax=Trifolium subterraneum TaxID=3900 RepID=A0A2Z6M6D4_TRISU|nr:hypothetical protein TSUD_271320 [Trifolium subterraneum]
MANEEIIGSSSVGATERPFKFEGNHFKRWQQKMFFFLTLKKCAYVLKDPISVVPDVPTDASASGTKEQPVNTNGQTVSAAEPDKGKATAEQLKEKALQIEKERQLWIDNDYVCKNYIINGLEDDLYDYYRTYDTASDVWEALSKKYDTEEAGAKKYAVSKYLKYQMVDERSVEVQSHELQKIAHEIITEGMPLHEQFQISVIIDKLPPSWKDFKNQLCHKTKEFSIEGLITRLRIEEESRKQDMKEEEKILVVSNNNKKKFGAALKPTGKPLKIQNQSRNQNRGHMSKKCRNPKRPKPANLAHINVNVADEPYTCMITEINMVGGTDEWWIDIGATRHVCYDRAMFKTYTNAENKKVQMGNAHTSDVAGIGDVVLKFTSGKTLILKEVLHVPEMKKNLVSGFLLNKAGFNQTIGADMYTITKNGIFIGKGLNESDKCIYYKCDGNICTIICLYVDDMLIFGSNLSAVNNVKSLLGNNFDMKDLGEASVSLGIKITSVKLFKNTGDSVRQTEYASIIGSLRYATDCTRPDIAYVMGLLCRFTSRPSNEHWHAIERVMRYLKRTMNLGLHYQRFPASTMESEMIALATASEEASWLRCLLSEIPLWEKPMPAVLIHCDSTAAIAKIENRFYNGKRRQIRRKHSTVRELITTGAVRVDHVRTNDNLADPLTKGLTREKVQNTSVKMGLKPMNCL